MTTKQSFIRTTLLLVLSIILLSVDTAYAEYRAYLIEVYDHISKKKWDAITGFSPDKYILTHGGGNRLTAFTKATWVCYGDTSNFPPACSMPKLIEPFFKVGDRVKINLEKHPMEGWIGIVELAYFQKGVNSNVYGVRFGDKRKLYNRFFEFNLQKTANTGSTQSSSNQTVETTPAAQTAPETE